MSDTKYFKAPALWKVGPFTKEGKTVEYFSTKEGLNKEQVERFYNSLKEGCGFRANVIKSKEDGSTIGFFLDIITSESMKAYQDKTAERKKHYADKKPATTGNVRDINY